MSARPTSACSLLLLIPELNTHINFLHHDAVNQMPQHLMRVLLRSLSVLLMLRAEMPEEGLWVEDLLAASRIIGDVEILEEGDERLGEG